jgi:hypothetical protein
MKRSLTRAWNQIAPKVLAFLTTGLSASLLITLADKYLDVTLEPGLAGFIVTAVAFVAGYIKKDSIVLPEDEPKHLAE